MKSSILNMDATTLANKIKTGEITSLEAVNTFINHITHINPIINAMVEERFEEARIEAKKCDEILTNGAQSNSLGNLFGVPISVKEAFDVAGMKTTGGLIQRKNHVAETDAEVVKHLKDEGAIILGKTNTPTLCFCQESENKLYGRTNNPWDVTKTAGGSSGGEAAFIAAGGAAVGIGSDIGGSIRFPSHFNGVIGFKSGSKTVSQQGHFPFVHHELQERMLGIGAIAKSVNDAELIHDIVAISPPQEVDEKQFKVLFLNEIIYPIGKKTLDLYEQVKSYFSGRYNVEMKNPPFYETMAKIWQLVMSIDGGDSVAQLSVGSNNRAVMEFAKERILGRSDTHRYLTWALIGTKLFKPSDRAVEQIYSQLSQADEQCQQYFNKSILVLPVYHSAALNHGQLYKQIFSIKKTYMKYMPFIAVANTLGLPSLTVPVGTDEVGMPIGFQLVTSVGNEKALFHFGRELESHFRGYVRCDDHDI